MSDIFRSSKIKIARAKDHVREFERQIIEFANSDPYAVFAEIDLDASQEVHKVKLVKPVPDIMEVLADEVVYHLRSSLDLAVYALKRPNYRKPCYFPIRDDANEFEKAADGLLKGLPKEIVDRLRAFQPYKGGNDLLVALHKLSNTNKHGILSPVAVYSGGIRYNRLVAGAGGSMEIGVPTWDRTKNEMVLLRAKIGTEFEVNLELITNIVICDVDFVDGKPADAVLNHLVRVVEGIIIALEVEARRLGLC